MASKGFGLGSNLSILGAVNILNEIAWNGSNTSASYTNLVTTGTLDGEIVSEDKTVRDDNYGFLRSLRKGN